VILFITSLNPSALVNFRRHRKPLQLYEFHRRRSRQSHHSKQVPSQLHRRFHTLQILCPGRELSYGELQKGGLYLDHFYHFAGILSFLNELGFELTNGNFFLDVHKIYHRTQIHPIILLELQSSCKFHKYRKSTGNSEESVFLARNDTIFYICCIRSNLGRRLIIGSRLNFTFHDHWGTGILPYLIVCSMFPSQILDTIFQ